MYKDNIIIGEVMKEMFKQDSREMPAAGRGSQLADN